MADALAILLRLRGWDVQEAKRKLAQALALEAAASHRLDAARAAPALEAAAVGRQEGRVLAAAYGAWLPRATAEIAACQRHLQEAAAATEAAIAALVDRRAALKAAETLVELKREAARKAREKQAQSRLDEIAQARR